METTSSPPPVQAPPKRPRRWLRMGLAFVVSFIALVGGFWLYLDHSTRRAWDEAEAELDQADPRWRLMEIDADRPAFPDHENGALVIVAIAPKLDRSGLFYAGGRFEPAFENLPANARLNNLQVQLIQADFAKLPELHGVVAILATLPRGKFEIKHTDDWIRTSVSDQQLTRRVTEWLKYDAYLLAEKGESDKAMDRCRTMFSVAGLLTPESGLIILLIHLSHQAHAVATLERVLAQGEASEAALRMMQAALERELKDDGLVHAMRWERAGIHHLMTNLRTGKVKDPQIRWGQHPKFKWTGWIYDWAPSTLARYVPEALRFMTEGVEIARLPIHERGAQIDAWNAKCRASSNPVILNLAPAIDKVNRAGCRNQALLGAAAVGVACERYRLLKKDWPAKLDDLLKEKLLDAVPMDPFANRPLRYRKLADGIVIYSVGVDGIDNGGRLNREDTFGKGVDIGFRMWDVGSRRQPALPPIAEQEK